MDFFLYASSFYVDGELISTDGLTHQHVGIMAWCPATASGAAPVHGPFGRSPEDQAWRICQVDSMPPFSVVFFGAQSHDSKTCWFNSFQRCEVFIDAKWTGTLNVVPQEMSFQDVIGLGSTFPSASVTTNGVTYSASSFEELRSTSALVGLEARGHVGVTWDLLACPDTRSAQGCQCPCLGHGVRSRGRATVRCLRRV